MQNFANGHNNISTIQHNNLADHSGKLCNSLGRHNYDNGMPNMFDTVHLGSKGIIVFCNNLKNCIVKLKKRDTHGNSNVNFVTFNNVNSNSTDNKHPYWKPNPGYKPAHQQPIPHPYPWTGDHGRNFPVRNLQPFHLNDLSNGYQAST